MTAEVIVKCQHCGKELQPDHKGPCPSCGSNKIKFYKNVGGGVVGISSTIRVRQKRKPFRKFMKEILQGWFPSGSPKLKKGVNKIRIVDKEKNEYHETVKDAMTGEVIRDIHEPLSQHKHQPKQRTKEMKK